MKRIFIPGAHGCAASACAALGWVRQLDVYLNTNISNSIVAGESGSARRSGGDRATSTQHRSRPTTGRDEVVLAQMRCRKRVVDRSLGDRRWSPTGGAGGTNRGHGSFR